MCTSLDNGTAASAAPRLMASALPPRAPAAPDRRSGGLDASLVSSSSSPESHSLNASTATVNDAAPFGARKPFGGGGGAADDDSADAASVEALEQRIREGGRRFASALEASFELEFELILSLCWGCCETSF
jgi:hypothetical protein